MSGLSVAFKSEQSFRWEVVASLVVIPLASYLAGTFLEWVLLVSVYFLVLMAELLNSAIEVLADKVESKQCEQIKRTKDFGSAAVFISLLIAVLVWLPFLGRAIMGV